MKFTDALGVIPKFRPNLKWLKCRWWGAIMIVRWRPLVVHKHTETIHTMKMKFYFTTMVNCLPMDVRWKHQVCSWLEASI